MNKFRLFLDTCFVWVMNNKTITFLGLFGFCCFVSTCALASQRNSLQTEVNNLKASLTTTTTTTLGPTTTDTQEETTDSGTGATNEINDTTTEVTVTGVTDEGDGGPGAGSGAKGETDTNGSESKAPNIKSDKLIDLIQSDSTLLKMLSV